LKIKKAFYFWAAASLIVMALIFWFSSKNSDESAAMSSSLTQRLFATLLKNWASSAETVKFINSLETVVRKSAHFIIYTVLGFCVMNTVRYIINDKKRIFLISLCWSSFYAVTDEFHQYFVPGRACMWQDWLIDTVGVLCGIGIAFLIVGIIERNNRNNRDSTNGKKNKNRRDYVKT